MLFRSVWVVQLVIAPAHRAGDPGSIPGPDENFSLKSLMFTYVYSLLIDKNFSESRNISVKFSCALLVYL